MIKDYIIKERLGLGVSAFGIIFKVLKKSNNIYML